MARWAVAATVVALIAVLFRQAPARADVVVIGGREVTAAQPIAYTEGKDFLAPLVGGIDALGITVVADGRSATLTTARGVQVSFTAGSQVVTANGKGERVQPAPALVGDELWLPFRTTCRLLGLAGRWNGADRRLLVYPLITKVSSSRGETSVMVRLESTCPISTYNAGTVHQPERVVVDLLDIDLAGPAQDLPSVDIPLLRTRVAQNALDPDIVRLVMEVTTSEGYTVAVEDAGCTLVVRLPAAPPGPPPTLGPVSLTRAELEAAPDGVLHLRLSADGLVQVDTARGEAAGQVTIIMPNGVAPASPLQVTGTHPLFSALDCQARPEGGLAVTVRLTSAAPYAVYAEGNTVHLFAGRLPLRDLVVVVDPGHGGNQSGALAVGSGACEKDLNLDIAQRLVKLLRAAGSDARLTRDRDTTLQPVNPRDRSTLRAELTARAQVANECGADLFISIHCNASLRASDNGIQTWYYSNAGLEVAKLLQEEMVRAIGRRDGGIHRNSFVVLTQSQVPAVLLETGFLTNPTEARKLTTPAERQKIAEAVYGALQRYVEDGYLLAYRSRGLAAFEQGALPSRGGKRPAGGRK